MTAPALAPTDVAPADRPGIGTDACDVVGLLDAAYPLLGEFVEFVTWLRTTSATQRRDRLDAMTKAEFVHEYLVMTEFDLLLGDMRAEWNTVAEQRWLDHGEDFDTEVRAHTREHPQMQRVHQHLRRFTHAFRSQSEWRKWVEAERRMAAEHHASAAEHLSFQTGELNRIKDLRRAAQEQLDAVMRLTPTPSIGDTGMDAAAHEAARRAMQPVADRHGVTDAGAMLRVQGVPADAVLADAAGRPANTPRRPVGA